MIFYKLLEKLGLKYASLCKSMTKEKFNSLTIGHYKMRIAASSLRGHISVQPIINGDMFLVDVGTQDHCDVYRVHLSTEVVEILVIRDGSSLYWELRTVDEMKAAIALSRASGRVDITALKPINQTVN